MKQQYFVIVGLFLGIMMLVVGAPHHLVYAQQQEWKTYYKPSMDFSVDYPLYNGTANITEKLGGINTVTISIPDFIMVIHSMSFITFDPEKQAVQSKVDDDKQQMQTSDVNPILVDGLVGYSYFSNDPKTHIVTTNMFFRDINHFYKIHLIGFSTPSYADKLTKIQNTLKFFD